MRLLDFFTKKTVQHDELDIDNLPNHIGIIMDGNGRWAQKRGLPRSLGHKAGATTLKNITKYANRLGIKHLTVYALSTENWKRPQAEVDALMNLLNQYLDDTLNDVEDGDNIRFKFIGFLDILSEHLKEKIKKVEKKTEHKDGITLHIALNYGGRDEILYGAKCFAQDCINQKVKVEHLNQELFEKYLYDPVLPQVDLIIRPSGEYRLSNFLLWQSAYAEFYFDHVLWPDYTEKHFKKAIIDFQKRHRRFGGL